MRHGTGDPRMGDGRPVVYYYGQLQTDQFTLETPYERQEEARHACVSSSLTTTD